MGGRAHVVPESRPGEFLGPAAAADRGAALDHEDTQAGGAERDRGRQAVRPAAHDHGVSLHRRYQTCLSPLGGRPGQPRRRRRAVTGAARVCRTLRIMELCQTLLALRHCRLLSTQTLRVVTVVSAAPSRWPSAVSVCTQNTSSLWCPPSVIATSYRGSLARISTWAWMTVPAGAASAENVIQPADMCACGVISVNDASAAESTKDPGDSLTPPPMARSRRATSPGLMPVSAPAKRFPLGQ